MSENCLPVQYLYYVRYVALCCTVLYLRPHLCCQWSTHQNLSGRHFNFRAQRSTMLDLLALASCIYFLRHRCHGTWNAFVARTAIRWFDDSVTAPLYSSVQGTRHAPCRTCDGLVSSYTVYAVMTNTADILLAVNKQPPLPHTSVPFLRSRL